jgi:hypothetical protein
VQAIRDGRPAPAGVRDGARATIACLAMLESAQALSPRILDLERALQRPE